MPISSTYENSREQISNLDSLIDAGESQISSRFSPGYLDAVFTIWYKKGKPSADRLIKMLPNPPDFGISSGYPSVKTVRKWIDEDFIDRAVVLDEAVSRELATRLIAEKVQMLDAHSKVATEMQETALTWIRENKDKLSGNSAVRLLVEGVRIERESRGIPHILDKISEKSDEDLLAEIEGLLLQAPVQHEQIDD